MGLYNSLQQFFLVALNIIAGESDSLVAGMAGPSLDLQTRIGVLLNIFR